MSRIDRRRFLGAAAAGAAGAFAGMALPSTSRAAKPKRPNILFAISDDQSWPHAGAYGCKTVQTPAFDRVAREGILFENGFCPAPQCSPCRASTLTGRNIWQNEEAGTHASNFPRNLQVYPFLLEEAGYWVGYTGKAWGPGNYRITGWPKNPAGDGFNQRRMESPDGISNNDYAANFADFLKQRPDNDQPFCFWYGATEPHRGYKQGIGVSHGKRMSDVVVPPFLPDHPIVRTDILDYCYEIDWFDRHLGHMLDLLEGTGELDNTLIVVTGDNGMPFPRAKANLYEYGTHMPLAICWANEVKGGRTVSDLVSFIDFAPTFLEAAGLDVPDEMTGRSLMNVLTSEDEGRVDPSRDFVLTGRERHTHARPNNFAYPARAIRTDRYLFIWNLKPDRWPAGDPPGYFDIDGSPTKSLLVENKDDPEIRRYFELAVARRPEEELYDIQEDPGCLENLAGDADYAAVQTEMKERLQRLLTEQGDPRMRGSEVFESYPRYSAMRGQFEGFKERGEYNPEYGEK